MPFKPGDYGWDKIFHIGNQQVTLPEQLTKKWWDKKKSTIAKITHSTGVGEALSAVEAAFKKVEFQELNGRTANELQISVEDRKSFIKSAPVKNLHDALKDAKNLATEQAKELKKNPLTKSTSKVLEEIAEVSDYLMVACNPNSLVESLKGAIVAWQKAQTSRDIKLAPVTVAAGKKVVAKIPAELSKNKKLLEAMQDDNDAEGRQKLANALRDLCRDITQPLGNTLKVVKAGVSLKDFDQRAADGLYKQMVVISDSRSTEDFAKDLPKAKMTALEKKVADWANEFARMYASIEIVGTPTV
jgi:hypothetical protein